MLAAEMRPKSWSTELDVNFMFFLSRKIKDR
jgi:hypothetical protein